MMMRVVASAQEEDEKLFFWAIKTGRFFSLRSFSFREEKEDDNEVEDEKKEAALKEALFK